MSTEKTKTSNTPEKKDNQVTLQRTQSMHIGPIPAPDDFEKYEKILPGSADRILSMAEDQQHSNIWLSKWDLRLHYASRFSAHTVVLIVALSSLWFGSQLILEGSSIEGIATIIAALAGFALAVIFGKSKGDA